MATAPNTSAKNKKKSPARKPKRKAWDHNGLIMLLMASATTATFLVGGALAWFLSLDVPDIRTARDYRPLVATTILDCRGQLIDTISRENRIVITRAQMPSLLPKAFVAAEDSRFFEHPGLDSWSILRALINNLRSGRRSQGGSTITQQVTRALMLSREKTYFRKFTEAILSYRLERMLRKEEILEIYLNEIYLGQGAYGVEAASRTYFGKPARSLSLAEIALLAGLPQSPSRYAPLRHPEAAKARQRYVLNRMAEDGYISADRARTAYATDLDYRPPGGLKAVNGYFARYVRQQISTVYGEEALYYEGLTVTTSLDGRLQEVAGEIISRGTATVGARHQDRPAPQGALIALDTASGRIRAMIGGTDFHHSQFNRAVDARRQPGSVFKPLVFAAAFEQGISSDLRINDQPFSVTNSDGSKWSPKNYDGRYLGPTSLADALIQSRNIVSIKLLKQVGVRPVIRLAQTAGIQSQLRPELPLALGASPVSLLEMTAAYTTFGSGGLFHQPVAITRVRDRNGRIRPWPQASVVRVVRAETARELSTILGQAIAKGTGQAARGVARGAGKTGTTDNNRDAWFIGYTPELTTGIWLGHDRNQSLGKGETGGKAAAPLWKEFMLASSGKN